MKYLIANKTIVFCVLLGFSICFGNGLFASNLYTSNSLLTSTTDNIKGRNVHFTLKAVPGVYWLNSGANAAKSNGAAFGFGYGANVEFGLTETIYLVTGIEVAKIGAKYTSDSVATAAGKLPVGTVINTTTATATIQYLQVPLFFKLKTKSIGLIKYYGQFGLGSGIAISGTTSWSKIGSNMPTETSGTYTGTSNAALFREALLIGGGLEYNLSGSTSLVGGITYDNGFLSLLSNKSGPSGSPNPTSLYSKGITITIGIQF